MHTPTRLGTMCSLYIMNLSRDEICGLLEHYKLAGQTWSELFEREQAAMNESDLIYPK